MAERGLRVLGAPPSGPGLEALLRDLARSGAFVTSFQDSRLRAARTFIDDEEAQFVPFLDLVGRFLGMMGRPILPLAKEAQQMALLEVISRVLESDSAYAWGLQTPGGRRLILHELSRLRLWRVGVQELRDFAAAGSDRLGDKLRFLADVESQLLDRLAELDRSLPSQRIRDCLDSTMPSTGPISRLLVLAGDEDKPLFEDWLAWAAQQGVQIDVVVDSRSQGPGVFRASDRLVERTGQLLLTDSKSEPWHECLFADSESETGPATMILEAADPLYEAEWAARECQRRLNDDHLPHEIAFFCRQAESYIPLLQAACLRFGVPLRMTLNQPLLSVGFARLTLDILRAAGQNDVRKLTNLARTSYLPHTSAELDSFREALAEAARDPSTAWEKVEAWSESQNPVFLWLTALLKWRRESEPGDLAVWLGRLRDLIGHMGLSEAAAGSPDTEPRDSRAMTVMQGSLADAAWVEGPHGELLDLRGFCRRAEQLWEEENVVVSGGQGGVAVVSHPDSLTSWKTLIVLGMLEGVLPRRRTEGALLSDPDYAELNSLSHGKVSIPDSHEAAAAERAAFVRICAAAESGLILAYPATKDEGDNVPAFYLEEVKRARAGRVSFESRTVEMLTPSASGCLNPADLNLAEALGAPKFEPERVKLTTPEAAMAVAAPLSQGVSPSEFANVLACPFQSAMRHRLKLKGRIGGRLERRLDGLIQSSRLVERDSEKVAALALRQARDQRLEDLGPELEAWQLALLKASSDRLIDRFAATEFSARESWVREESWFNVGMGDQGLRANIPVGGEEVVIESQALQMYEHDGVKILVRDMPMNPADEKNRVPLATDAGQMVGFFFEIGLHLLCLSNLARGDMGMEIIGREARRLLLLVRRGEYGSVASSSLRTRLPDLHVQEVQGGGRDAYLRSVRSQLKEAVNILREAEIPPKPGVACEGCPYGELCRSSVEYGDGSAFSAPEEG